MKRLRHFLLVFILISTFPTFGQTASIDSLQRAVNSHSKKDTVRVNLLNNLATQLFTTDTDRALRLLKESESLALDIHFKKGQAYANLFTANALIHKADFKNSIGHIQTALKYYEELRDKEGIANSVFNFGRVYYYMGDYGLAETNYKRAITLCDETGDLRRQASCYIGLGALYAKQSEHDKSFTMYSKALQIDEKLGNKKGISNGLTNLGNLYKRKGDYPAALQTYLRSAEIKKELGDMLNVAHNYGNIGTIYDDMDKKEEALRYYQMAMPVFEKLKNSIGIQNMSLNIGVILMNQGDYKNAREHLTRGLKLAEESGAKDKICSGLMNVATLDFYEKKYDSALNLFEKSSVLGLEMKSIRDVTYAYLTMAKIYLVREDFDKALDFAQKSEALSKEHGIVVHARDAALLLSDIYYAKKEYKLAFEKRADHKVLMDSIYNRESLDKLADVKYEHQYKDQINTAKKTVEEKESELQLSEQEKMWWIAGSVILLISLALVLVLLKVRKVKMENRQLLMEQKLRRTQMNPHFIFNSLQNVGSLIREKKEGEAVQYLNQFSKLTRQILESSDENYVSLEDEIDLLKNYIGIQQMLYGDRFNFKISVDDEIDPESVFLPPMLTQPFIENAIKHGLKDKTEGELNVRFFMEDKKLYFEVIDNGAGFGSKTSENHKSMAMEITRKRLSFYTKEKSPQVLAENITDALQNVLGAQVRFEIPYIYEN